MRQYNTAITLALFLGGLVVDARSLPERRSEINVRYSMRDTTLGKRDDIQGNSCLTLCDNKPGDQPDPSDCEWLYMNIQSNSGSFDLAPCTSPSLPQDYDTKLTDARDSRSEGSHTRILCRRHVQQFASHHHLRLAGLRKHGGLAYR